MRSWLVTGLLLCASSTALAQTALTLGAHAGVSVAQNDALPVAGASLEVALFRPFTLRVELEYSQRGVTLATSTGGAPLDARLDYLSLPVNLRYDLATGQIPMYVFAGTTVGALVAASADTKTDTLDLTLDVGGGLGYRVSPQLTIMLDVRGAVDTSTWEQRDVKVVLGASYRL